MTGAVQDGETTTSLAKDEAHMGAKEAIDTFAQDDHSVWSDIAHTAHAPHGALHAIEAGEQGIAAAGRLISAGTRVASSAAEAAHDGHHGHGVLGKVEHGVVKGAVRAGAWMAASVSRLPGGAKLVSNAKNVSGAPSKAAGAVARAADSAIAGTRVGNAVKFSGSSRLFLKEIGGRIPVVGAALGGVIAAVDIKDAIATVKDPHATTKDKVIAGSQGTLSGVSGLMGVGALGVAAGAALGLSLPVTAPFLLGGAAITGVGAFALSFFKKKAEH